MVDLEFCGCKGSKKSAHMQIKSEKSPEVDDFSLKG